MADANGSMNGQHHHAPMENGNQSAAAASTIAVVLADDLTVIRAELAELRSAVDGIQSELIRHRDLIQCQCAILLCCYQPQHQNQFPPPQDEATDEKVEDQ